MKQARASNIELSMTVIFLNAQQHVDSVLSETIQAIEKAGVKNFEIFPVDNGSTLDNTWEKLNEFARKHKKHAIYPLQRHDTSYGLGMMAGLKRSRGKHVGWMWGNNKVPNEIVTLIYKKLVNEDLDLCKAFRMAREYSFLRKLESFAFNAIVFPLLFGKISEDINGCPKIMKRSAFERMKLHYTDSFFDSEAMIKAKRMGLKIGEVETIYVLKKKEKPEVKFASFVKPTMLFEFWKNIIIFKLCLLLGKEKFS